LRLRESKVGPDRRPWFELQVRTLAEDIWAEIEHLLGYKPQKGTFFAVRKQFQILSVQLGAIDEHLNFLNEELHRLQQEVDYGEDDLLNAENLPGVLSEATVGCTQQELGGLLKLLTSRGFRTISDFRGAATADRLERIRATYLSEKHRLPTNFEVVANLATLQHVVIPNEQVMLIRAQIKYLEAWDSLKISYLRPPSKE
jgi:putative GTP pyrophosphokinase